MTTIPPRSGRSLQRAVDSLYSQQRQPDGVVVSASAVYKRFPGAHANLSALAPRDGLDRLSTCEDLGPGTKLLCALPRLRELAYSRRVGSRRGHGGGITGRDDAGAFAVLLDDDLRYRPWALSWLERAITDDTARQRHAYSYDVYTITADGRAVTGGLYPGLLVGAGHALYAIRISMLDGLEDFFQCVRSLEPRATYHDDVVISMFLQDIKRVDIYRLGGAPYEVASKTFPEVHENTVSYMSPGALIRLAHDAGIGPPAAASDTAGASAGTSLGVSGGASSGASSGGGNASAMGGATTGRLAAGGDGSSRPKSRRERAAILRWERSHPHGAARSDRSESPAQAAAAAGRPSDATGAASPVRPVGTALVGVLEGGSALLRKGASVDEARAHYSRKAVTAAMGDVRMRILTEGLCGVPRNSSVCVGSWCASREWGIGGGKALIDRRSR